MAISDDIQNERDKEELLAIVERSGKEMGTEERMRITKNAVQKWKSLFRDTFNVNALTDDA